jgi:cullin-associated NEDD8-dissociated protein 1
MDEEEDQDELDGFDDDEDFEEEIGADDDDSTSWKVRRCAAKAAAVLISTRNNGDLLDDGTLYSQIAPALVARFKEKQESVRLEVLAALSLLIRITSGRSSTTQVSIEEAIIQGSMGPPPSRKRRRGGSDASMLDAHHAAVLSLGSARPEFRAPSSIAMASLVKMSPEIVRGTAQLLSANPLPKDLHTKQSSMALLKDLAVSLQGQPADYLGQTVDAVIDSVKISGGLGHGASAANANNFRIEALQFLGAVAKGHSTTELNPYLAKIVPSLITASRDRFTKVSVAALTAMEQYVLVLTPPRSLQSDVAHEQYLSQFYSAITDRISANDADLEVRRLAIHVLGFLLGLTADAPGLISPEERNAGLELLANRLKNELTRLASVRAVDTVLTLSNENKDYHPGWIQIIAMELGAQLRKSSRTLRGSSLGALKTLALNDASCSHLSSQTIAELVPLLLPLLKQGDLHMMGPALLILATFIEQDPKPVVNNDFIDAFCTILYNPIAGSTLEAVLTLVRTVGEKGVGQTLMQTLLRDVSLNANPEIVGKVVGNLLVSGSSTVGVKLDDFVKEASKSVDDKRKCLALSVLGEAALRLGSSSPLTPPQFMLYFSVKSDKVPLVAAVALGRAGAGNVPAYLPTILQNLSQASSTKSSQTNEQKLQYLLLHSIREIVSHEGAEGEIVPYTQSLWQNLLTASQAEDNRAIGAECIGRLAIIDPKTYLPQLQVNRKISNPHQKSNLTILKTFLTDQDPGIRGMVISSLRYVFADADSSYDNYLAPIVIPMLKTMLGETDLENRRLALTTLNSAAHNKPDLILPHLSQLLPFVMKETVPDPKLIREVQMGPFKHKVDDGLEIRKSAYETLYALLESAFPLLDIPSFYDRIIEGIKDDHDIRTLSTLMLQKLIVLAPEQTQARLEVLVEPFRGVLGQKPKENAVKQEIEKMNEERRDVVRVSVALARKWPDESAAANTQWGAYWEWVRKENAQLVKQVEDETKEKER